MFPNDHKLTGDRLLDLDVMRHYGKADAWQCFFGQNVAKFIRTPMFVRTGVNGSERHRVCEMI